MSKPKVTLVSTLPFKLRETKPGMFPSHYEIEAAPTRETLGITHIGDAHYHELTPYGDSRAPLRRVDIIAERVAEGLILDYTSASLAVTQEPLDDGVTRRTPGMFWVPGVLSGSEVFKQCKKQIDQSILNTVAWFEALVMLADDDWQKNRQHKMITDLQRHACTYLGLKNREWNVNTLEIMNNVCWSCKSSINSEALMCSTCKAILKPEEYEKRKSQYATV